MSEPRDRAVVAHASRLAERSPHGSYAAAGARRTGRCRWPRLDSSHEHDAPRRRRSPAELRSTPVDGVDVLGALSPSRASDFMTCPLALPLPHHRPAPRGAVGRRAARHPGAQGAGGPLRPAVARRARPTRRATSWCRPGTRCSRPSPTLAELFTDDGPRRRASGSASCRAVLDRYFTLEDPRRLEPAERELYVEALLDSRLLLRGLRRPARRRPRRRDPRGRLQDRAIAVARCSRPRRCSR